MRKIFLNDVGRLRSGWRVLIFLASFVAISYLIDTVLRVAYAVVREFAPATPHSGFIADVIFRFSLLGAALGAGYLCTRFLEGLPWRSLGLTFHTGWFRDLVIGFVVGFASLVIAVAIAFRGLHFSFTTALMPTVRSLIGSLVLLFVAALAEEAMFRGYGLQTLSRAKLAWLGVLRRQCHLPWFIFQIQTWCRSLHSQTRPSQESGSPPRTCGHEVYGCRSVFTGPGIGHSVGSSGSRLAVLILFPIHFCAEKSWDRSG